MFHVKLNRWAALLPILLVLVLMAGAVTAAQAPLNPSPLAPLPQGEGNQAAVLVLPEATGEPSGPVDPPGDAGGGDDVNSALPALVNFFLTSTQTLYTEFTNWIQTRDLFTYAAVAVFAILLVLITRNQTPNSALKPMLDTARAISTDLVAALEREAERRYELAKGTPQGYDDAFYQFLMTVMRDVRTKMDEQPPRAPAPPEDAEG